jgi:hypothetical protein
VGSAHTAAAVVAAAVRATKGLPRRTAAAVTGAAVAAAVRACGLGELRAEPLPATSPDGGPRAADVAPPARPSAAKLARRQRRRQRLAARRHDAQGGVQAAKELPGTFGADILMDEPLTRSDQDPGGEVRAPGPDALVDGARALLHPVTPVSSLVGAGILIVEGTDGPAGGAVGGAPERVSRRSKPQPPDGGRRRQGGAGVPELAGQEALLRARLGPEPVLSAAAARFLEEMEP